MVTGPSLEKTAGPSLENFCKKLRGGWDLCRWLREFTVHQFLYARVSSPFILLPEYRHTYLVLLRFALLRFTGVAGFVFIFIFLQIESKTFHRQKDCDLLYCDTRFIAAV